MVLVVRRKENAKAVLFPQIPPAGIPDTFKILVLHRNSHHIPGFFMDEKITAMLLSGHHEDPDRKTNAEDG